MRRLAFIMAVALLAVGCSSAVSQSGGPVPAASTPSTQGPVASVVPSDPAAPVRVEIVIPVFTYHHVKPNPDNFIAISPQTFEAQLKILQERGFTGITPGQLEAAVRGEATLPPKPVMLTFDDGWKHQVQYAVPLLKRYGFTATFFVYPKPIFAKSNRFMSRTDLKTLVDNGFAVESHTWDHTRMSRGAGESPAAFAARAAATLGKSKSWLESVTGKPVRYLAYPYGDYDASTAAIVEKAGYQLAFTVDEGPNALSGTPPLQLKRFSVFAADTLADFEDRVESGVLQVAAVLPSAGAQVGTPRPLIRADLDASRAASVHLELDLKDIPTSVETTGGTMSIRAVPARGLSRGFHWVTLVSDRPDGRRDYASWGFNVR